jgi:hypothetical protein
MHQKLSANPAHTIASILQRRSFFLARLQVVAGAHSDARGLHAAALPTPLYQDEEGIRERKYLAAWGKSHNFLCFCFCSPVLYFL